MSIHIITFDVQRRIAASLGLPVAADDRQFATELPLTSPGFPSPDALGINVRIARATGDIMTCETGHHVFPSEMY